MTDDRARTAVEPFLLGRIRLTEATVETQELPGPDAFGNEGRTVLERFLARGLAEEERSELAAAYLAGGFTELPRDSHREDDLVRFRRSEPDPANPFLQENDVEIGLGGRDLTGPQRALLAKKADSLRRELDSPGLAEDRRALAAGMLEELEAGLRPRVSVQLTRRVFRPDPILDPDGVLGSVVPLRRLSQLVYTVVPADPADREDEAPEPMYLTVLGVGSGRVSFLYSGGLHGQRTVTELADGLAHHAWFQNRRCEETSETAPFVSRRIYRELCESGRSEIVVRRERDPEPIEIVAAGEEAVRIAVEGETRELPVLVATTEKDDRFRILADPECPLALSLEEADAGLLRTVDSIRAVRD